MTARSETTMTVQGDHELVIERTFRALPHLVFEAYTKAELVKRWWAPKSHGVEMAICEADVRPGGTWRYVMKQGTQDIGFSGEYREVTPHTRLVYTSVFDPFPEAEVLVTVTFEARGEQTHVVMREVYPSKEALDGALSSGMEHGMKETLDQLDDLVAAMG